ncbi:hypothetical protein HID58_076045, partial [Brassica napus]
KARELMIVDMILLDENSTLIQGTIHSILSGVISVKVLCIRLVDLRSHGATIISHSLTPQSPFVSTIERPSQKQQTRRRIFPLSFFDSAATSSYEHWLIRTDNYHIHCWQKRIFFLWSPLNDCFVSFSFAAEA